MRREVEYDIEEIRKRGEILIIGGNKFRTGRPQVKSLCHFEY